MKYKFSFLVIAIFCIMTSCQRRADSSSDSDTQVERAMTLLEKGNTEEAIAILIVENRERPNERIRMILASAYASRAGIRVEDFWGFLAGYQNLVKNSAEINEKADVDSLDEFVVLPTDVKKELVKRNFNFSDFKKIRQRVTEIPTIGARQYKDTLLAVEALDKSISPGARLYRAILEVIVLKYSINQVSITVGKASRTSGTCNASWKTALDWVSFTYSHLRNTLSDVSKAYPSQSAPILDIRNKIQSVLQELPEKSSALMKNVCSGS